MMPGAAGKGAGTGMGGMMGGMAGMMGGMGGGMGGMGGGMGLMSGGMGQSGASTKLPFLEGPNQTVITWSDDHGQVVVHHVGSQLSKSFKASKGESVTPYLAGGMLALEVSGPEVNRIAVYDFDKPAWNTLELKEPLKNGRATPVVTGDSAFYRLGNKVYAYSSSAASCAGRVEPGRSSGQPCRVRRPSRSVPRG